ncbi:EF-hand domain-containing family member C2-like [Octopus vulgaris]|uniref:EF-hand domain-containing family member C2 n=1 Tax=Octopus vulgaris TaxID=6645 RepID=A0AA36BM65_OCTVU|nr:EF-hand domain-containing family member C2-like [Octopus vulgaris]
MAMVLVKYGNGFSSQKERAEIGKTKFHRAQSFQVMQNELYYTGDTKPGIGGEPHPQQEVPPVRTELSFAKQTNMPAWVAFDRQVLSFNAYYQESVQELKEETYRIHECMIYYHLEDDTIEVFNIKTKNSRLNQGTIIRRHRIPKPSPHDNEFFSLEDLNIGVEVNFFGKVFKIVNCDHFTYKFLYKSGVKIPNPSRIPEDPYTKFRKALEEEQLPLRPYKRDDTLKQFLDHDTHVLRFFCVWDDTKSDFGVVHNCTLYYFLADDTIEIREVFSANSGNDMTPILVKRGKLPKGENYVHFPGKICDRTLLNVFGSLHKEGRFIYDGLQTGEVKIPYYGAGDLQIGNIISVYGRPLKLCDCDDFTKNFYRTKYGIVDFTPIKEKETPIEPIHHPCPPYNGFGNEEETLQNCNKIVIQSRPSNFMQFLKFDKDGLNRRVMCFLAKMLTKDCSVSEQDFIINYYLADNTIQITLKGGANSGVKTGIFLGRGRVKLPNQQKFNIEPTKYYCANDFNIGAVVQLNHYVYRIVDADENTFKYMENHPEEFPKADIRKIVHKLKDSVKVGEEQLTKQFLFRDPKSTDYVSFQDMIEILCRCSSGDLSEHELITIGRFFKYEDPSLEKCPEVVIMLTQEQLRKSGFEGMKDLLKSCLHEDRDRTGKIPATSLRRIMLSHNIPLKKYLLEELIEKFPKDDDGKIFYEELLKYIDWQERPQAIQVTQLVDPSLLKSPSSKVYIEKINYRTLLSDMYPPNHEICDLQCNEKAQEATQPQSN